MNELTKLTNKQARLDTQQATRFDFRTEWRTNSDDLEHHRPIDKQAHLAFEVHVPCLHTTASIGCVHLLSTLQSCWLFPLPSITSKTITVLLELWERGDALCRHLRNAALWLQMDSRCRSSARTYCFRAGWALRKPFLYLQFFHNKKNTCFTYARIQGTFIMQCFSWNIYAIRLFQFYVHFLWFI
jgi:hypothetical protein